MWYLANRHQAQRWSALVATFLLLGIGLVACGGQLFNDRTTPQTAQGSATPSASLEPSMELTPDRGYGGLYIQVSGAHWPPNMMILVTLEDEQGRSDTLAATDTDRAGNLSTGFLYPIDERWLASIPRRVVVTTADGRTEAKAKFAVVPPGTETEVVATESESPSDTPDIANSEVLSHVVALPLVSAQLSPGNRTGDATANARSSSDSTHVEIQIAPGKNSKSVNCHNEQEIFSIAILTTDNFNAATVDPGTVTVTGSQGGSALSAAGFGSNVPVAFDVRPATLGFETREEYPQQGTKVSQNWGNYRWRWSVEDVDGDGDFDLILEYRLSYIELTCDATAVTITGRTKDGQSFTSVNQVKMTNQGRG